MSKDKNFHKDLEKTSKVAAEILVNQLFKKYNVKSKLNPNLTDEEKQKIKQLTENLKVKTDELLDQLIKKK